MAEPLWLISVILQVIHDDQIASHGGVYGVRDEGLLDSEIARARNRQEKSK